MVFFSKHIIQVIKSVFGGIAASLIMFGTFSCSSNTDSNECTVNMECPGASACVLGACVSEASQCRYLGVFETVAVKRLSGAEAIGEAHTTIDDKGTVHYCYKGSKDGQRVSFYGIQRSAKVFEEVAIQNTNVQSAGCSALAIASTGIPYVLDAENAVLLYQQNNVWRFITLPEIETNEERALLSGIDSVINLTPDTNGGMYIGISAGYTHTEQVLYTAHVLNDSVTVLQNGIRFPDTAQGHAPEFVEYYPDYSVIARDTDTQAPVQLNPAYVTGDLLLSTITFRDIVNGTFAQLDGGYHRTVRDSEGSAYVLYVDTDYILRIARFVNGAFFDQGIVGQVTFSSPRAQIPWTMAVNPPGSVHVLYEDMTQGANTLSYRDVRWQEESDINIVSTRLSDSLGGAQHYAVHADICGRATVAVFEQVTEDNTEMRQTTTSIVLMVKEKR